MKYSTAFQRFFIFVLLLVPAFLLLMVPPPAGAEEGADLSSESPLVQKFEDKYRSVLDAVQEGALSAEAGEQADELKLSLQKYLIQSKARIDIYKLEARQTSGPRQDEALQNLIQASAERERTLLAYIQRLNYLSAGGKEAITVPDLPLPTERSLEKSAGGQKQEGPSDKDWFERGTRYEVKELDIEIEIKPEDIINEPQVAD